MASITKRGHRWLVQVRRKGEPPQSRMFKSQVDAKAWAVSEEARIERAEPPTPRRLLAATTLSDIIGRYLTDVTPTKRSAFTETQRLKQLQCDPIAKCDLGKLDGTILSQYRDRRLTTVKPATVRRELAIISHALEVARKEWGFRIPSNPVKAVRQPALNNARDRRLIPGEIERLDAAISQCRNPVVRDVVHFAIESAMRRGEILAMVWRDVDLTQRIIHIPQTKTGKPRTIPLTDAALEILQRRARSFGPVFPISANALKLAWVRAVKRADLDNLHFHDLRHEAVSRFFEMGLSLPEVAVISGHRDPRMLFRYTHLRPLALVEKLKGKSWIGIGS